MEEKTIKKLILVSVWIIMFIVIGLFYYMYDNVELVRSDPCKMCEDKGNTCYNFGRLGFLEQKEQQELKELKLFSGMADIIVGEDKTEEYLETNIKRIEHIQNFTENLTSNYVP